MTRGGIPGPSEVRPVPSTAMMGMLRLCSLAMEWFELSRFRLKPGHIVKGRPAVKRAHLLNRSVQLQPVREGRSVRCRGPTSSRIGLVGWGRATPVIPVELSDRQGWLRNQLRRCVANKWLTAGPCPDGPGLRIGSSPPSFGEWRGGVGEPCRTRSGYDLSALRCSPARVGGATGRLTRRRPSSLRATRPGKRYAGWRAGTGSPLRSCSPGAGSPAAPGCPSKSGPCCLCLPWSNHPPARRPLPRHSPSAPAGLGLRGIEVEMDGIVVRIGSGASPEAIAAVIRALRAAS